MDGQRLTGESACRGMCRPQGLQVPTLPQCRLAQRAVQLCLFHNLLAVCANNAHSRCCRYCLPMCTDRPLPAGTPLYDSWASNTSFPQLTTL